LLLPVLPVVQHAVQLAVELSVQVRCSLVLCCVQFDHVVDVLHADQVLHLLELCCVLFGRVADVRPAALVLRSLFCLLSALDPVPDASPSAQEFRWHAYFSCEYDLFRAVAHLLLFAFAFQKPFIKKNK